MPFNPFMYGNPAGVGQQTAVGQAIVLRNGGAKAGGRKGGKRSAKKRRAAAAAPRKRKAKRPARLVKGSAAAKAHMAKIRRKRR